MIAFVRGIAVDRSTESVTIDVAGVGYQVLMPASHAARVEVGEETTLHTLTYVREDQFTLFGFVDGPSRTVFAKLITINKVGPKLALAIMSTLTLEQLRDAALQGNVAALKRIKGVGGKTAERLALELKDMVDLLIAAGTSGRPGPTKPLPARPGSVWDDATSALGHLGYADAQIDQALSEVRADDPELDELQAIVRSALVHLKRK